MARKRSRIKNNIIMILLLLSLLTVNLLGGLSLRKNKDEKKEDVIQNEPQIVNGDPDYESMPDSFLGTLNNEYDIPEGVIRLITDYMDAYYKSLYTLERVDTAAFFDNELMTEISTDAISILLRKWKLYDFDFSMRRANYDLKISAYRQENGVHYVDVLEDDHFRFAFLNGIDSSAYDIENRFEIVEKNGSFKIRDLYKEQGYYTIFYDDASSIADCDKIYDYYVEQFYEMHEYYDDVLKNKARKEPYSTSLRYAKPYNRQAAVDYSYLYCHSRNPEWYNFTDEGGNCQNYASQSLLAGGIEMDYHGDLQWKCYIEDPSEEPEINPEETQSGRTRSWVNVNYFYNYALDNDETGLVADVGGNVYYAEPGDIVIVGNGGMSHTFIVSKVEDGHILVNSNSIDMKDYPLEAFTYTNIMFIKILGCN